ncbi:MAG: hypothetical protein R3C59_28385 [Planctomycetaceae bacterium]
MARLARAEVFAADEVAIVHVMNRTVRRCFLLGDDPITGQNFDHRKQWLDDQLVQQAKYFGIDLENKRGRSSLSRGDKQEHLQGSKQ